MATARLMETWAHGHDITDALGVDYPATASLRHIAHLGVRTRAFSYHVHGRDAPDVAVRVELEDPRGEQWSWGPVDESPDLVRGPLEDFCLVVTQRRRIEETWLETQGEAAREWLQIAQVFAGRPTTTPPCRLASLVNP